MTYNTSEQFDRVISRCRKTFISKNTDYGTSWRVLRPSSITDQISIKAQRIRSLEEKGVSKVDEGVESEFEGIINYCIIALIQLEPRINSGDKATEPGKDELIALYDKHARLTKELMEAKNHDYGEAWRNMRISTFTDMILMRLLRIRQIEDNQGKTLVSEGPESNYRDMMNYAIFALIRLQEKKHAPKE